MAIPPQQLRKHIKNFIYFSSHLLSSRSRALTFTLNCVCLGCFSSPAPLGSSGLVLCRQFFKILTVCHPHGWNVEKHPESHRNIKRSYSCRGSSAAEDKGWLLTIRPCSLWCKGCSGLNIWASRSGDKEWMERKKKKITTSVTVIHPPPVRGGLISKWSQGTGGPRALGRRVTERSPVLSADNGWDLPWHAAHAILTQVVLAIKPHVSSVTRGSVTAANAARLIFLQRAKLKLAEVIQYPSEMESWLWQEPWRDVPKLCFRDITA